MKTIKIFDSNFETIDYIGRVKYNSETATDALDCILSDYLLTTNITNFPVWEAVQNNPVWNTEDYGTIRTYSTGGGFEATECRIKYLGMDLIMVLDNEDLYTLYYNRCTEITGDPFRMENIFEAFPTNRRLPNEFLDICQKMMVQRVGDLQGYKKYIEKFATVDTLEYYKSIFGDDFHRVVTADNIDMSKLSTEAKFYIDRYGWDVIESCELETEDDINNFVSDGYFITCDGNSDVAYISKDLEVAKAICKLQNAKGGHFTVEFDDDYCWCHDFDNDAPYTLSANYSGKYTI